MSLAAVSLLAALASNSLAATIHGDFEGEQVMFLGVSEDSATDPGPLWEAPTVSGDALVFNPSAFGAFSQDGSSDTTDGTLEFTLMSKPGGGLHSLSVAEVGDYALAGAGTVATALSVTGQLTVSVLQVDDADITPVGTMAELVYDPSGGTYNLINDAGIGVIWTGAASIDIDALLSDNAIQGTATKIAVTFNNMLAANSEANTIAHIKKKNIGAGLVVTPATLQVPEPSSLVLAGLGLLGGAACVWRRRRRK